MNQDDKGRLYFAIMTEIGIIDQLSRNFREARLPDGLLHSHFGVLSHLARGRDGATPLEIANAFQLPKTTISHTLSGLEKRRLVDMRPNPDDARSKQVWITPAGREVFGGTIEKLATDMEDISGAIDPEDAAFVLPILSDLRAYFDRKQDG